MAKTKRLVTADDLLRLHILGDAQISPDGLRIAVVKKQVGEKTNT